MVYENRYAVPTGYDFGQVKCYSTQRNKDKYLRNDLSVSKLPNLKDLQIVLSNYERDL